MPSGVDLYSFAAGTSEMVRVRQGSRQSLYISGLRCGVVTSTTAIARFPNYHDEAHSSDLGKITEDVLRIERLISRERRPMSFGAWASHVLQRLSEHKNDIYIMLGDICCDHCETMIAKQHAAAAAPIKFYHCRTCSNGDFDVCCRCYEQKGKRCRAANHILSQISVKSVWVPYHHALLQVLAARERGTQSLAPAHIPSYGHRSPFIEISFGTSGSSSTFTQLEDMVVVFFGGAVPFLIRKQPSGSYRLISDCYVEGLMNGGAVDMWRQGRLDAEEFEIV